MGELEQVDLGGVTIDVERYDPYTDPRRYTRRCIEEDCDKDPLYQAKKRGETGIWCSRHVPEWVKEIWRTQKE